jgi:hypothetical protein
MSSFTFFLFHYKRMILSMKNYRIKPNVYFFETIFFNLYRFPINQSLVIIMNRSSVAINLLIFDKHPTSLWRQISASLGDLTPCDIELTNQMVISSSPELILFTQLDNQQSLDCIDAKNNITLTIARSNREFVISTFISENKNIFLLQCYVK